MKKKILILSSLVMLFVGVLSINTFASSFNPDDTFEEVNPNETISLIYEPDLYYLSVSNSGTYVIDKFATFTKGIYEYITTSVSGTYYNIREQISSDYNQSSPNRPISHRLINNVKGNIGSTAVKYNVITIPHAIGSLGAIFPESPDEFISFYWKNVVISGRDINNKTSLCICGRYSSLTDLENDMLFTGTFSGSILVKGEQSIQFNVLPFNYEFSINPFYYRPNVDDLPQYFEIDLFSYFFESFGLEDSDYLVLNNATMAFEYTRPNGNTYNNTTGMWGRIDTPTNAPTLADVFNSYDFSDLQPTIDFEDISYVDWIVNSVKSFIDFEIFPNFSIGNILGILISMALAIWILKVFMGG